MGVGWGDAVDTGAPGESTQSLWGGVGQVWVGDDCGSSNALPDCYLPLLSPQECWTAAYCGRPEEAT